MENRDDFRDQVRKASDITEVISDYLPLKKRGRDYWACCPFHGEKTPSFSVSKEKQFLQFRFVLPSPKRSCVSTKHRLNATFPPTFRKKSISHRDIFLRLKRSSRFFPCNICSKMCRCCFCFYP